MNIHQLTPTEASYLLFAIRKTLEDENELTPEMTQFYDSTYAALSAKIQRCRDGDSQTETRHRYASVRPTWDPESLAQVSRDLAGDNGKV